MKLADWNLNKNDCLYLIILLLFAFATILYRLRFHMSGGVFSPDKAVYLINALLYSGMDFYNIVNPEELFFTPIISFLTSLLFRLGLVDQLAISLVSAFFAILGYLGFYLLLKRRFDSLLSLTGVIILGSISEVLFNLASGLLDVPAISISIWILLISIIATDKNPKYFIYLFPLFIIAFFSRYTTGFILPVVFLYYIMKRDVIDNLTLIKSDFQLFKNKLTDYLKSPEFRYILISIILAVILTVIITKFLILDFGGSLSFIEQSQNTFNGNQSQTIGFTDFLLDKAFYIKNFSEMLFNEERTFDTLLSYLLYSIIIIGLFIKSVPVFKKLNESDLKNKFKDKSNIIYSIILIGSLIGSFIGFKIFSNHLISNILLIISLYLFYHLFKEYAENESNFGFFILNIGYFSIYFIFISLYPIKVIRYALPLLPPFIFFIIWGLKNILDFINKRFSNESDDTKRFKKRVNIIPILIIILFIISTFTLIEPMKIEGYSNSLVDVSDYISTNDPDYHTKTFSSNNHNYRLIKWNLKVNVDYVNEDPKMLDSSNTTYIIDWNSYDYENYHEIYNNSDYHVYYHN